MGSSRIASLSLGFFENEDDLATLTGGFFTLAAEHAGARSDNNRRGVSASALSAVSSSSYKKPRESDAEDWQSSRFTKFYKIYKKNWKYYKSSF